MESFVSIALNAIVGKIIAIGVCDLIAISYDWFLGLLVFVTRGLQLVAIIWIGV